MSDSASPITLQRLLEQKTASTVQVREHRFDVDINEAAGGEDLGPDPHDLYDAALGACKSLTIMWLAKRNGMDVQDVQVVVTRDASEERNGLYRLKADVKLKGNLSAAEIASLTAAAEKCPVHKLMTGVQTIVETRVKFGA